MSKISLTPNASGTGNFTIASPNSNTDRTLTLPDNTGTVLTSASTITPSAGTVTQSSLATGVAGTGPSFSAYVNNNFSTSSNVFTKVQCNVEDWDTGNCFDSTTNYRFTPNIAGYYQFSGGAVFTSTTTRLIVTLYKNGSETKKLFDSASTWQQGYGSAMIYCNGTTDYVELYCRSANANTVVAGNIESYFQGFLARSA